jgi:hypothetical protein
VHREDRIWKLGMDVLIANLGWIALMVAAIASISAFERFLGVPVVWRIEMEIGIGWLFVVLAVVIILIVRTI